MSSPNARPHFSANRLLRDAAEQRLSWMDYATREDLIALREGTRAVHHAEEELHLRTDALLAQIEQVERHLQGLAHDIDRLTARLYLPSPTP